MCLEYYSKEETEELRASGPTIKCWKSLDIDGNRLRSYFQDHIYRVGENLSTRENVELDVQEKISKNIHDGIHVYLNKKDANEGDVTIPVYGQVEDLVGVGDFCECPCAVFTKIYIKKEDYEKALDDASE